MRIAWATDVHLNFVDLSGLRSFAKTLTSSDVDAVVLTGDISEAPTLAGHLEALAQEVGCPIYFVMGNHDFYRGSVEAMRTEASQLSHRSTLLHYLPAAGVVPLGENACLIGVDGWGDGRSGDPERTEVFLTDFLLIDELRGLSRLELIEKLRALGDEDAALVSRVLSGLPSQYEHVLIATHVPPFIEACWHGGGPSSDQWLPWFTCVSVGEAIRERLADSPARQATVLCGHTHSDGFAEILPNLRVHTGGAEYREPRVAGVIEIDEGGIRLASR